MKKSIAIVLLLATAALGADTPTIPETWLGEWTGPLVIEGMPQADKPITMTLAISKKEAGVYHWKITYNNPAKEKADVRNYLLKPSTVKNHWVIDEQNGLEILARVTEQRIVAEFEMDNGSRIATIYRRVGDTIEFELFSAQGKASKESSLKDGQFTIKSAPIAGLQSATLKKK